MLEELYSFNVHKRGACEPFVTHISAEKKPGAQSGGEKQNVNYIERKP